MNPTSIVRLRMLKIIRRKEANPIAVITGSRRNNWGQFEQC
jgi:hypothetical protein